jgi:hypothetical protein
MKTKLMHYLSLIYLVNQPLHDSGVFIAHHQEVFTVYVQQFINSIGLSSEPAAFPLFILIIACLTALQ